ncbi:hypothetical protein A9975_28570 [Cupriavidus sp. UME77]|nr:hypothetical protein [Cupriavidus sp. UME77]
MANCIQAKCLLKMDDGDYFTENTLDIVRAIAGRAAIPVLYTNFVVSKRSEFGDSNSCYP